MISSILPVIVVQLMQARGNLIYSSNQWAFNIDNPDGSNSLVTTRHVQFQNDGRAAIKNIEIVLNYAPQHVEFWEPREFKVDFLANKRPVIKIANLNGKEHFIMGMIHFSGPMPDVISVKWEGGKGKPVPVYSQRLYPLWVRAIVVVLQLLGLFSLGYFLYGNFYM